ncbi:peroxiredoxin family protein [Geofilum sp. OHC36d9]|uniref:peroxiredoxin family protein n=1 Tax=Geofilum sp. OHC36d9 TaxID=3458413 RepID=UPI004033BB3E
MKIQAGQTAPDFKAVDIYGKQVRLSDFKGKKIAIGFFRNVNCPFCNRRVHQIMLNNISFKQKDVQLLFLFESPAETLKKSAFHRGISPWPLIGDPKKEIYDQYGVGTSMMGVVRTMLSADMKTANREAKELGLPAEKDKDASMSLLPADFFIDENFKIVKAHYGKHLDDHVDYNELLGFAGIENPFKKLHAVK